MPDAAPVLSRWVWPILIFTGALFAFAVGIAELPVIDRDEARFAQASRQMAATGDWIDIRFQEGARHNKPVLIYWLQAGTLLLLDAVGTTQIWVHRLPSVLAAALASVALVWAGQPLVGRRAALWAGVMLASVLMLHVEARIAKTDATLLLTIVLAIGALGRIWIDRDAPGWVAVVFWTALAAGLLVKGPIILMPVVGALLWLTIKARAVSWMTGLRPLPGFAWMLLLAAPWYVAIIVQTEGGFLADSLGRDLTDKVVTDREADGTPPGTYLLTFWITFFPWTILAPLAAVHAWNARHDKAMALLFGWAIPVWVAFELIPTKLMHYTLPTYPALILIVAATLDRVLDGRSTFGRWSGGLGIVPYACVLLGLAGLSAAAPTIWGDGPTVLTLAGAAASVVTGGAAILWFCRGRPESGAVAVAVSGALTAWTVLGASLPALSEFWIAPRVAEAMAFQDCVSGPVAMVAFHEPSTVFLLGTDTRLVTAAEALAALQAGSVGAAWMPAAEAAALGLDLPDPVPGVTAVAGTNYSNGDAVDLRLVLPPGTPATAPVCPDRP